MDSDPTRARQAGVIESGDAQLLGIETLVRRLQNDIALAMGGLPAAKTERISELTALLGAAAIHSARCAADAAEDERAKRTSPRLFELDALTELPNRALFRARFSQALAHARRRNGRVGVLFIDLDGFKSINDRYGHAIGDHVIRLVARRLASAVRDGDMVSRHGGDEFLVLLSEVSDAADAATLAGVVRRALTGPLRVGEDMIECGGSIGVSVYPDDGQDQETLVHRADEAMFIAKRRKRGEASAGVGEALPDVTHADRVPAASRMAETALRQAEHRIQALRESNEGLLVSAIISEDLHQRAERAALEQSELLSVSAHELRGSLFALQTATATLVLTQGDRVHFPRLTLMLQRQIANIARITAELLDVARLNSQRLTLHYASIDMSAVVSETVAEFPRYPDRPAMEMESTSLDRGALVLADAVRMRQVLVAILTVLSQRAPTPRRISVSVSLVDGVCSTTLRAIGATRPVHECAIDTDDSTRGNTGPNLADRHTPRLSLVLVRQLLESHRGTLTFERDSLSGGLRCRMELPTLEAACPVTEPRPET